MVRLVDMIRNIESYDFLEKSWEMRYAMDYHRYAP